MLRGAGYVSITSTMDAECGAISVNIGSCHWRGAPVSEWRVIRTQSKSSAFTRYNRETPWPFASGTRLVWGRRLFAALRVGLLSWTRLGPGNFLLDDAGV